MTTTDTRLTATLTGGFRTGHVFPTLTAAQAARIAAHGHMRRVEREEVLVEAGDSIMPFFGHTSSKRVCLACSRSAMSAAATSSGLPLRSARDRLRWRSYTGSFRSNKRNDA